jgi:hypothetical protein
MTLNQRGTILSTVLRRLTNALITTVALRLD